MPKKSGTTRKRMSSFVMSELHYALLDFMIEQLGGRKIAKRVDIIRMAVENWALAHELWDEDAFRAFVASVAEDLDADQRKALLVDLDQFLTERRQGDGEMFRMTDPQDLDISSSTIVFSF